MTTSFLLSRRQFNLGASATLISGCTSKKISDENNAFGDLETRFGGRLGVSLLNVNTGIQTGFRDTERFAMCSTFKALLVGLILREIEQGRLTLTQRVYFDETNMVPYAPVTSESLETGYMQVGALAEAAQKTSDNVAANLLLKIIGGPAEFTKHLRALGDQVTRLDRVEPELNLVPVGEIRDTTTPLAMAHTLSKMLFGDYLNPDHKTLLTQWMIDTKTGKRRIRAALPGKWRVGNKTGTGIAPEMTNKYNDVAVIWPTDFDPHILTVYYEAPDYSPNIIRDDEAILASAGSIAASLIINGFA